MIWIIGALLCTVAISWRLSSIHERPQLWWWAFSLTLLAIAAGSTFLANEHAIDRAAGIPHIAYLGSNLSFTVAAGSVQVFIHCLRRGALEPDPRWVRTHIITAAVVVAVITVGWLRAPVHNWTYTRFRDVPVDRWALAYDGAFHVYLGAVLANVAVVSVQQLRTTPGYDHGRRIGLILIGIGGVVDVAAHILYLARTVSQPHAGRRVLVLASVADILTVVCLAAITAGTISFHLVPRLVTYQRSVQFMTAIAPLWRRILQLYPQVELRHDGRLLGHSAGIRAERMLIEIQDALRLMQVPVGTEPFPAILNTLADPSWIDGHSGRTTSAVRALPTCATRQDEETLVLALANQYRSETSAHAS